MRGVFLLKESQRLAIGGDGCGGGFPPFSLQALCRFGIDRVRQTGERRVEAAFLRAHTRLLADLSGRRCQRVGVRGPAGFNAAAHIRDVVVEIAWQVFKPRNPGFGVGFIRDAQLARDKERFGLKAPVAIKREAGRVELIGSNQPVEQVGENLCFGRRSVIKAKKLALQGACLAGHARDFLRADVGPLPRRAILRAGSFFRIGRPQEGFICLYERLNARWPGALRRFGLCACETGRRKGKCHETDECPGNHTQLTFLAALTPRCTNLEPGVTRHMFRETPMSGSEWTDPRPMSPHLQVWKWHWTMASSIFHRVSGVGNYLGALLVSAWIISLATGPEAYGAVEAVMLHPVGQILCPLPSCQWRPPPDLGRAEGRV